MVTDRHEMLHASGDPGDDPSVAPDWFLALLRQSMTELMAGEDPPIRKANALARLGGLYLKACAAGDLARTQKQLQRRITELEARLAVAESHAPDSMAESVLAFGPGPEALPECGRPSAPAGGEAAKPAGRPPHSGRPAAAVLRNEPEFAPRAAAARDPPA